MQVEEGEGAIADREGCGAVAGECVHSGRTGDNATTNGVRHRREPEDTGRQMNAGREGGRLDGMEGGKGSNAREITAKCWKCQDVYVRSKHSNRTYGFQDTVYSMKYRLTGLT